MSGVAHRHRAGAPLRGLFVDGVWHCDCTPRQPANHFEVKKQGPNQGKWFRTCQKQQGDKSRCKFFLWDSDAHPREATALANNSRTESSAINPRTPSKRLVSPPPPYTDGSATGKACRKRTRATSNESEDEFGFAGSKEVFGEIDHVMAAVETPRKAARTDELATPSTRRVLPWRKGNGSAVCADGLQTPQTAGTMQVDSSPQGLGKLLLAPAHQVGSARGIETSSSSPYETPTPNRFKDVGRDDLAQETLTLLRDADVKISATTKEDLQALVSKHAKAAEGLRRGRDVARSTIKARDAKITELSYRISTLEAELEAERALVKHLQWEAETGDHISS